MDIVLFNLRNVFGIEEDIVGNVRNIEEIEGIKGVGEKPIPQFQRP